MSSAPVLVWMEVDNLGTVNDMNRAILRLGESLVRRVASCRISVLPLIGSHFGNVMRHWIYVS